MGMEAATGSWFTDVPIKLGDTSKAPGCSDLASHVVCEPGTPVTVASSPTTAAADSGERRGSTLGRSPACHRTGYEAFKSGVFYFAHVCKKDA